MSLNVRYRTGELLTYSLNCFSPREGLRVSFNGDRGRIEYHEFIGSHLNRAGGSEESDSPRPTSSEPGELIRVFPHFQDSYEVAMPPSSGSHGGADKILSHSFFSPDAKQSDPSDQFAGHEQGAASILVGIAGVHSIRENRPINITDLVPLKPSATRLSDLV